MSYLDTETLEYGLSEQAIRAANPDYSPPVPFAPPPRYALVFDTPQPAHDVITQVVREVAPGLSSKGHWEQQWEVVPRFGTQAEADAAVAVSLVDRLALTRQKSLGDLAYQYDARVQALASGYSQYERESWPVQTAEATAYSIDPLTPTPWLDAASAARGIDKAALAARVIAMDAAYRQIHGALTGHRQKLWDQINAAQTTDEIAAIDVTAGWPA